MDAGAFVDRVYAPALKKTGISGVRWHTLRHTAASRRIMAGVDLYSIKEFLGHRNIETTLRYAHLAPSHLKHAANRGSLFETGSKTGSRQKERQDDRPQAIENLVRPEGFEPPTLRSVV
jgi:hypothetical protein